MIVLTFFTALGVLWLCRRRATAAGGVALRGAVAAACEAACAVLLWCWAFRFPVLPRAAYLWLAWALLATTVLEVTGLAAKLLESVARRREGLWLYGVGVVWPHAVLTAMTWLIAPLAPFLVFWKYATPLQWIAPGMHHALFTVVPSGVVVSGLAAAGYTVWTQHHAAARVRHAAPVIVSQLHRTSMFLRAAAPSKGTARVIAAGPARRPEAHYLDAVHLADVSLSASSSPQAVRSLLEAVAARAAGGTPRVIFITGPLAAHDLDVYYARSQDAAIRQAMYVFAPLRPLCSEGRVVYCDAAAEGGSAHAQAAFRDVLSGWGCIVVGAGRPTVRLLATAHRPGGRGGRPCAIDVVASGHPAPPPQSPPAYRVSLAWGAGGFLAGAADDCHLTLCGGAHGGLLGFGPWSLADVVAKFRGAPMLVRGLWGRGPSRCFVSCGVGAAALAPPAPPLRLGVPAEAVLLALEVPP